MTSRTWGSAILPNQPMPIDFHQILADASAEFGAFGLPPGIGEPGGIPGGIPGGVAGGLAGSAGGSREAAPPDPVRIAPNSPQAIPVAKVDPIYPEPAIKSRVQGVVIIDVVVNRAGEPENLRLVRSQALLEQAALEAVRQWRWNPFLVDGRPTPFKVLVTVQFQLAVQG